MLSRKSVRPLAAALTLSAAGLVVASPRTAHAGCVIECTSIKNEAFTIDPQLACLTVVGQPDDNACVCSSEQRVRNDCAGSVQITPVSDGTICGYRSCTPAVVLPGQMFGIEVRDAAQKPDSGPSYTNHVRARYTVVESDDPKKTEHTIEIRAMSTIDPEASGCSASPRRLGKGSGNGGILIALGLVVASVARASRRRPNDG